MHKTFIGTIVSIGMLKTVVVEITRRKPHPLYRKLLRHSKRFKVDPNGHTVAVGDTVRIVETRPLSRGKNFKIQDIVTVSGKNKKETVQKEEQA